LPADLVAAAAANPGGSVAEIDGSVAEIDGSVAEIDGSVAEIDGSVVSDPNGYVPPEAIIGPELGHLL